ncbi:50S ribosomal protein L15 [Thelohanellus kitauei]|uniref:Large ribosomal subunit protein uL15m n=1 Tax=Thelohanellus kitauei TaxID=669202 RepID=A0A0C2JYM5_THEKT|nr:50S ribosomal protein L15 [Thelohanellus kitauei]
MLSLSNLRLPLLGGFQLFSGRNIGSKSTVRISNLRNRPGHRKKKIRLGRGQGSGRGKQAGRGMDGSTKSGTKPRTGFEGGQFPFYRMPPVLGKPPLNALEYTIINLHQLEYYIRHEKLDPSQIITMADLIKIGAVSKIKDGVVLLGSGKEHFQTPIRIEVSKASPAAVDSVNRAGGRVTCVYMSDVLRKKYQRFFQFNISKTTFDFINSLPFHEKEETCRLMKYFNVATPISFPPQRLLNIYVRKDLGGFLSIEPPETLNEKHDFEVIKLLKSK